MGVGDATLGPSKTGLEWSFLTAYDLLLTHLSTYGVFVCLYDFMCVGVLVCVCVCMCAHARTHSQTHTCE